MVRVEWDPRFLLNKVQNAVSLELPCDLQRNLSGTRDSAMLSVLFTTALSDAIIDWGGSCAFNGLKGNTAYHVASVHRETDWSGERHCGRWREPPKRTLWRKRRAPVYNMLPHTCSISEQSTASDLGSVVRKMLDEVTPRPAIFHECS